VNTFCTVCKEVTLTLSIKTIYIFHFTIKSDYALRDIMKLY